LRPADQIALIALAGIVLSLLVWLAFAYFDGVLVAGGNLLLEVVYPEPRLAWHRLVAIVGVLVGTLVVQIVHSMQLEARQRLSLEESRVREAYENSPDLIISMDRSRHPHFANLGVRQKAGLADGVISATPCHVLLYGAAAPCPDCPFDAVMSEGTSKADTICRPSSDGSVLWYDRLLYPIVDEGGKQVAVVETLRDVTEQHALQEVLERCIGERTRELRGANDRLLDEIAGRQRMAENLAASEHRYRSLVEDAPDMVLVHDTRTISFVNAHGLALLGANTIGEVVGKHILSVWDTDGLAENAEATHRVLVNGTAGIPASMKLKRLDGGLVDVEVSSTRLEHDGTPQVQCVIRDVTERVRAQQTIERMAYYDGLTGLPNRTLFRDRLATQIARSKRAGTTCVVAFIDIDDFKVVNDTLGHLIGDGLLCAVAGRLRSLLRESDTVAHQSGDEFLVVAEIESATHAEGLAQRIMQGLAQSFRVEDHELHITTSIGVALCPQHADDEIELLKKADTAMYRSKEFGNNHFRIYTEDMGEAAQERLRIEVELRRAIEASEFVLHYQPQVDVKQGCICGVEALIRWEHPERGLLLPGAFLPIAEQTGLITPIGRLVLEEAVMTARAWYDDGLDFGRMAVNLSAREFMQPDLIQSISATLDRSGLPPHLLELEITETVAMHSVDHVLATLRQIHELGVRIAIDDFGTGYSAMSYLQHFPMQTLKIAQTFMRDVCHDANSAAIASAVIELCRILDLDVIAEGVETLDQVAFLEAEGAFMVQGYAFYRPLPLEEVRRVLLEGVELPNAS
jgi:diguanylate cyclase (GGDEF)-like protein/PAS domain S-box-containing protein